MTTYDYTVHRQLEQLVEWAEQALQSYTCEHENAERQYRKIITERRNRNYSASDYCDWSEYGTKTLASLDKYRRRITDRCFLSREHLDKARKDLDDYMASIVVPCAEAVSIDDALQDVDAPLTTCCPGNVQDTYDSSSSDDEDDEN